MNDLQEKYKNRFPVPSCGKCDFRDTVVMINCDGTDETVIPFFKKSKIYVRDIGPIKIETYQDFIPYMHFIISSACFSKEGATIHLSKESWIDTEERDSLQFNFERVLKYYKKCKRDKKTFDYEGFAEWNKGWDLGDDSYIYKSLIKRFQENQKKAIELKTEGIHTIRHQRMRYEQYTYALKNDCDISHPLLWKLVRQLNEFPVEGYTVDLEKAAEKVSSNKE